MRPARSLLLLLSAGVSLPAACGDTSALVQTDFRVHRDALRFSINQRVAEALASDEAIRRYVADFTKAELSAHRLLFQYATASAKKAAVPEEELAELPPLPSGEDVAMGPVEDKVQVLQGLLEALEDDAFYQNLTSAVEEVEELVRWFNESAEGHVELYLQTTPNETSEKSFAMDFDSFLRHWSHLEMDFLLQLLSLSASFAKSIPVTMLKSEVQSQLQSGLESLSAFVAAMENITIPNLSGMNGENFCPMMVERMKRDTDVVVATNAVLAMVSASKRMLPSMGEAFMRLMPQDAPVRAAPARVPLVLGTMLNVTDTCLQNMRDYRHTLTSRLVPLLANYMDCEDVAELRLDVQEADSAEPSEPGTTEYERSSGGARAQASAAILASLLAVRALW